LAWFLLSDRYYDGTGNLELPIDECLSITQVSVSINGRVASSTDYTDLAATEYYAEPFNWQADGNQMTRLVLDVYSRPVGSVIGAWYSFRKAVKIVGIFGYSVTVDERIAQATKMQAVRWFMRAKQGYQDSGANAEIGQLVVKGSLQLDPDIRQLLYPFKLELG
jgi:hypothetical protein